MKKFYYLVASMAFVLVVIMSCEKSAIGVDELQTTKQEVLFAKGDKSQVKVDILHWDGEKFILISVAGASVESHMAHGDKYPCEPDFVQDFTTDVEGWFGYGGEITHEGDHAIVEGGAYTVFDGYKSTWTGTWTAEIDVYLDPAWANNQGFDYSVAASKSDGNYLQDYFWHVGQVDGVGLLVTADNNNYPGGVPNNYILQTGNDGNHYNITTGGGAGWYTLQQVFYDDGSGVLAVDFNLIDIGGTTVWTTTRSTATNLIPSVVGGNRYGWFVFINVDGGIAVDNTLLTHCE